MGVGGISSGVTLPVLTCHGSPFWLSGDPELEGIRYTRTAMLKQS